MILITLPLYYNATKSKKILYSLNNFLAPLGSQKAFNMFYQFKAKKHLMKIVKKFAEDMQPITEYPVQLELTIFRESNRQMDVGNVSIAEKYTTDSLVQSGILEEDNYNFINQVTLKMHPEKSPDASRIEYKIIEVGDNEV